MNNGKLNNFMQPIGLGKEQKRKSDMIKNIMIKYCDKSGISRSNDSNFQPNLENFEADRLNVIFEL
jgi:hypothetical protein